MIINYYKNEPEIAQIKLGVQENNLTDILEMIVTSQQGNINLSLYNVYLKICSHDKNYVNKIDNTKFDFKVIDDGTRIKISYALPNEVTRYGNINIQIAFEKTENNGAILVWQTQILNVLFEEGIDVNQIIINNNPDVIRDMKKDIENNTKNIDTNNKKITDLESKQTSQYIAVEDSELLTKTSKSVKNATVKTQSEANNQYKAAIEKLQQDILRVSDLSGSV